MKKVYRPIINLDGTRLQIEPQDLDKNGKTGGIEAVSQERKDITPIMQPTETGEVIKEAFKDEIEDSTGLSSIELKSNIHDIQSAAISTWNYLSRNGVIGHKAMFLTRTLLRTRVSVAARGREDVVRIAQGQAEKQKNKLSDGTKAFMGMT
jgi:hypothetical protein